MAVTRRARRTEARMTVCRPTNLFEAAESGQGLLNGPDDVFVVEGRIERVGTVPLKAASRAPLRSATALVS